MMIIDDQSSNMNIALVRYRVITSFESIHELKESG